MKDRKTIESLSANELMDLIVELELLKDRSEAALLAIRVHDSATSGAHAGQPSDKKSDERLPRRILAGAH